MENLKFSNGKPEFTRLAEIFCRNISNTAMKQYLQHDAWKIIETGFNPANNKFCESCFSIGNGRMGQRANFEEQFSGSSLQGSYVAGFHILKELGATFQKPGFPAETAESVNAPNWIGIDIQVDGEVLDLATCKLKDFRRVLNMRTGILERSFTAKLVSGKEVKVRATRFCSLSDKEVGAIRYAIKPINFDGIITIQPYVDGDVRNSSDLDENLWTGIDQQVKKHSGYIVAETQKTEFRVCVGMKFNIFKNKQEVELSTTQQVDEKYVSCTAAVKCKSNDDIVVYKYAGVVSSFEVEKSKLLHRCQQVVRKAYKKGFDKLLKKHTAAWAARWEETDITVEEDVTAQQAIRFNIFQLCQTYSGEMEGLSISPKGFTGEQNPGATWEAEAFCLPFFLAACPPEIARKLLLFRYRHLPEAIENAAKLGFTDGAALYPTAAMTGGECHDGWEIAFGGIHRNGAIAWAIFKYIRFTGDQDYLTDYGLEVLIAIARFWAQRVHWSQLKQQYVIHGVTGPNEYESNVNNNWYTNYIAVWCLKYAMEALKYVESAAPAKLESLLQRLNFDRNAETAHWEYIAKKMYFPKDESMGIFLQQENFLDKELHTAGTLPPEELPLNQHWSWDRILRSCFIQQADVLQGFYFFENHFSEEDVRRNFEFYEPMTVHETSHSSSLHAVLAARLGKHEKACEYYHHTARLDLEDLFGETKYGLHIASMAGAWMAFVKGFGGMRVETDMLSFTPFLPEGWNSFSFRIQWRGYRIGVRVSKEEVAIFNQTNQHLNLKVNGQVLEIGPESEAKV